MSSDSPPATSLPLWAQTALHYRTRIMDGRLKPGDKIPAETELAKEHSVSAITIRKALNSLESEGLVTRARGRGTFVTQKAAQRSRGTTSLATMFSEVFEEPAEIRAIGTISPPERLVEWFPNVATLGEVIRVAKLGNRPWSYGRIYVLAEYMPDLSQSRLERYPVYRILQETHGVEFHYSKYVAQAIAAPPNVSDALSIPAYSPVLFLSGIGFNKSGKAIIAIELYLRGEDATFQFETLHGKESDRKQTSGQE